MFMNLKNSTDLKVHDFEKVHELNKCSRIQKLLVNLKNVHEYKKKFTDSKIACKFKKWFMDSKRFTNLKN